MIPTGWSSTSSVLSAIVATQAVRLMDTPTAGLGPRGPPSDSGAAGATVTPRSPLPGGNASIREVLGRLARHSVRPGACAKRAARCWHAIALGRAHVLCALPGSWGCAGRSRRETVKAPVCLFVYIGATGTRWVNVCDGTLLCILADWWCQGLLGAPTAARRARTLRRNKSRMGLSEGEHNDVGNHMWPSEGEHIRFPQAGRPDGRADD